MLGTLYVDRPEADNSLHASLLPTQHKHISHSWLSAIIQAIGVVRVRLTHTDNFWKGAKRPIFVVSPDLFHFHVNIQGDHRALQVLEKKLFIFSGPGKSLKTVYGLKSP